MVPCVKDNNLLGTQKTVPPYLVEGKLARTANETLKYLPNSRRRYMARILPIRRKTNNNQSINQSLKSL